MLFSEFAHRLHSIIGAGSSTVAFTKSILEAILSDDAPPITDEYKENAFKAFFNGNSKITRLAKKITAYIEPENFANYIDEFSDATHDLLVKSFIDVLPDATMYSIGEHLAGLFENILKEAAMEKRKSPAKHEPQEPICDDKQIIFDNISGALMMVAKASDAVVHNTVDKSCGSEKKADSPQNESTAKYLFNGIELCANDETLLKRFRTEAKRTLIYIFENDPSADPIKLTLADEIQAIITSWQYDVREIENETLRKLVLDILTTISAYTEFLSPKFLRYHSGLKALLYRNQSIKEGDQLRDVLRPQTYELRLHLAELYKKLFPMPEDMLSSAEVVDDKKPSGAADASKEAIAEHQTIVNQYGDHPVHIEHVENLKL